MFDACELTYIFLCKEKEYAVIMPKYKAPLGKCSCQGNQMP